MRSDCCGTTPGMGSAEGSNLLQEHWFFVRHDKQRLSFHWFCSRSCLLLTAGWHCIVFRLHGLILGISAFHILCHQGSLSNINLETFRILQNASEGHVTFRVCIPISALHLKLILLDTDLGLLMAEVYSVRVYPLQSVLKQEMQQWGSLYSSRLCFIWLSLLWK